MGTIGIGLLLIAVLFLLVLLGMRIAVALMAVAFAGVWIIRGNFDLAMKLMSIAAYSGVANYLFATIPLFVLMGHLVSISNVGKVYLRRSRSPFCAVCSVGLASQPSLQIRCLLR